jgi:hypothetical protein
MLKKKSPAKDDECGVSFLNYYTAKSMKKEVTRCVARNVMSGTTTYALVRKQEAIHLW